MFAFIIAGMARVKTHRMGFEVAQTLQVWDIPHAGASCTELITYVFSCQLISNKHIINVALVSVFDEVIEIITTGMITKINYRLNEWMHICE